MQHKAIRNFIIILLGLILPVFAAVPVRAQNPGDNGSLKLDVYVSESKIVSMPQAVDEVTSSEPALLTVEKVKGMDSQVAFIGVAVGDASVTVKMADGTRVYQVKISPMPQRMYINIPESKYLNFKDRIDDYSVSVPNVVRILQPTEKELLLEALPTSSVGNRTTLTIYCKGEITRYYISTFENRGADLLEIQNAFTLRGYNGLSVKFENDQATIAGSVPTQEELDDAVRVVKRYTPYVQIKAQVGAFTFAMDESDDERLIVNNILRIAQVKGLTVRVKFAQPKQTVNSTYTRVVGQPAIVNSVTDNQTRLTTNTTQLPTDNGGPTSKKPVDGTIETVTTLEDKTVPEKIFLFGELEDDLAEARAIRVARTFCPFVVSMVTVKDPIQVRLKSRLLTVDLDKSSDTGIKWASSSSNKPSITGGINYKTSNRNVAGLLEDVVTSLSVDVNYTLQLSETKSFIKQIQEMNLMLSNGQPSELFRGEMIPYVSSRTEADNGSVSVSTSFVNIGLRIFIVPLNYERASQNPGEQLNLLDTSGKKLVGSLSKYYQMPRAIGMQGSAPVVDESLKYVDENGLIGMCVYTEVSAFEQWVQLAVDTQAPQTLSKNSVARIQMREGQSLVVGGLLDDQMTKTITSVPGFNKIPIFGWLFESKSMDHPTSEMLLVFTPDIIRLNKSPASKLITKPYAPEVMDMMEQQKLVPTLKPVRYDARGVDLRSDSLTVPKSIEIQPLDVEKPKPISLLELEQPKPEPAQVIPVTDLSQPASQPAAEVVRQPVSDTADAPQPVKASPAPEPRALLRQPVVDTVPQNVNNLPSAPSEVPSTLP